MIVRIDKSFEKDTNKIKDKNLLYSIADSIELLVKADNIKSIKNIKKIKGSNYFYRIRLGDYRIGLEIKNETIELIRFLHRKDIYKFFPK
jgi:mRNA interferase RelE/StbE